MGKIRMEKTGVTKNIILHVAYRGPWPKILKNTDLYR